ncbi:hypothetical protein FRC05_001673 [Tulasnella sp. 425]|nr:hypothetical protein FRC05_001673 [Tulasnella sp. 425]
MACSSTRNGLHWSIQFYPFQHYHIVQHIDNDNNEEESIQAAASGFDIPLPDSRPESPEFHGPDGSPRSLDLYLYITALSHQYLSLRSTLVRPLLPEEARAIRAELRPRLGSLERRARERRGL